MAKRTKDIHIEPRGIYGSFAVYSDLAEYQIRNIEGIISVDEMIGGFLIVVMDPRWLYEDIIGEIEKMALDKSLLND